MNKAGEAPATKLAVLDISHLWGRIEVCMNPVA